MSVLSDRHIRSSMAQPGGIRIEPLADDAIQPSTVDVRLGSSFRIFPEYRAQPSRQVIIPGAGIDDTLPLDADHYVMQPGELVLGVLMERVSVPLDMVCRLHGKSSLGRIGLLVHVTAGLVDAGNTLNITLELVNLRARPLLLTSGMKIGQLEFELLTSPCEVPYGPARGSRYYGDSKAVASKIHLNL